MVADCVLRCHGPKVDHVCIVPICDDSGLWKIVEKEQLRPAGCGTLCSPRGFSAARQTMDEHDARACDQLSKAKHWLAYRYSITALTWRGFTTRGPRFDLGMGTGRLVSARPSLVLRGSTLLFRDRNLRTMALMMGLRQSN